MKTVVDTMEENEGGEGAIEDEDEDEKNNDEDVNEDDSSDEEASSSSVAMQSAKTMLREGAISKAEYAQILRQLRAAEEDDYDALNNGDGSLAALPLSFEPLLPSRWRRVS